MKSLPDDVVFFLCCLFAGVLFLWCNLESVDSVFDMYLLYGGVVGMVFVGLFFSRYLRKVKE